MARKIGMDPVPLFDATSAMVDPDDDAAREILVTTPRVSSNVRGIRVRAVDRGRR